MHDSIKTTTGLQPARQNNLELLKALAIISMIFCHPVIRLGIHCAGYESTGWFFFGDMVLGDYLAVAHALMFAMGVGMTYTRRGAPADLMRRGVKLYLLGYALNFCRYGVYALADGIISGVFYPETLEALFGPDILQFAGLALFATGVFKNLRLREGHILAVGLVLSMVGAVAPSIDVGNYAGNWLLGHFVVTTWEASCFAFFNWYVFVAAGLGFGTILHRAGDPDRLYRKLLAVSGCVMAVYLAATFAFGPLFLTRDRFYYAVSTPEAAGLLSIDLFLLSAFHFLLKRVDASKFRVALEMSRNVTPIYLIHWCILGFIDSIFCYLLGFVFPWPAIYGVGLALLVASFFLARLWRRGSRRKPRKD